MKQIAVRYPNTAIVLLLLLVPLALSLVQSPFSIFVYRDGFALHYPAKRILIDQIKQGQIPYWNPAASFGQPLLANPNLEPFYPGNLVFLLLPFDIAWNFHFWFHWLFGMLGVLVLLRSCHRDLRVAWMGSICWGGSGYVLSLFSFFNLIAATAWIPWILYCTRALLQEPGARRTGILALCIGFQFLAGEPVTSFASFLILIFSLIEWRKELTFRKLALILMSGAVALLIGLPQILALREVYPFLTRSRIEHVFDVSSWFSFEPRRIWEWFVPYCNGIPYEKAPHLNPITLMKYSSSMLIPSVHLSFLLLFGFLLGIRKRPYIPFTALALLFLLTLGRYGAMWQWLYDSVPGFDELRFPIKFFGPCLILIILIATDGLQQRIQSLAGPLTLKSIALFLAFWGVAVATYIINARTLNPFLWIQIGVALILLAILMASLRYRKQFLLIYVIVEALVGARFLWLGIRKSDLKAASFLPGSRTYFSPKAFEYEKKFKNISELYAARTRTAYPLHGALQGFRYAFDPSLDGMYSFYVDYLGGFISSLPADRQFEILSYLGVNQIILPEDLSFGEWKEFRYDHLFVYLHRETPSVFATQNLISKATVEQTLKGLADGKGPFSRWAVNNARFAIPRKFHYREVYPSRFEFELEADGPVFLVTRITYVSCWRMKVRFRDGTTATLPANQVDLAFVGMEIPAGAQKVTVYYESKVTGSLLLPWICLVLGITFLCLRPSLPARRTL